MLLLNEGGILLIDYDFSLLTRIVGLVLHGILCVVRSSSSFEESLSILFSKFYSKLFSLTLEKFFFFLHQHWQLLS